MKRIIAMFAVCVALQGICAASTFDSTSLRTQHYIVKMLADTVASCHIAVLHGRSDEIFRDDDALGYRYQSALNLMQFRLVTVLKGDTTVPPYSLCYVYPPTRYATGELMTISGKKLPPPYFPKYYGSDDLSRLAFLEPKRAPLTNLVTTSYGRRGELKEIIEDVARLDMETFMDKHVICEVFTNRVYQISEGCVFRVDHPVPLLPETEAMRMNSANFSLTKARVRDFQEMSRLIHLSSDEVSEIVFTAYWLEGEDGAKRYEMAREANPAILVPLTDPADFTTEIGKRLFEAVKMNPSTRDAS